MATHKFGVQAAARYAAPLAATARQIAARAFARR